MLALPSVFKKSAVVFYMTLERRIQNSIEHRKWNVIFTKHFILDVKLDSEYVSTLKLQFQNEILPSGVSIQKDLNQWSSQKGEQKVVKSISVFLFLYYSLPT